MTSDLFSIRGRSALVTGASRGIDLAIAELFADTPEPLRDKIMDVNVNRPFLLSGAIGKRMVACGAASSTSASPRR